MPWHSPPAMLAHCAPGCNIVGGWSHGAHGALCDCHALARSPRLSPPRRACVQQCAVSAQARYLSGVRSARAADGAKARGGARECGRMESIVPYFKLSLTLGDLMVLWLRAQGRERLRVRACSWKTQPGQRWSGWCDAGCWGGIYLRSKGVVNMRVAKADLNYAR